MRRWMLMWGCASALWVAGLAVVLDPFGSSADLRDFSEDAALSPQPAGPADFYRPAEEVAQDQIARQKRAVAQARTGPADRRLNLFAALAILPTTVSLALGTAALWAWEDRGRDRAIGVRGRR
jgi:hypothetical protein